MSGERSGKSAESRTILVVDDETYVREAIVDILGLAGLHVFEAHNGLEALDQYVKNQTTIGAVILDMQMPLMDGASTLYALREINPNIKIIISSGYTQPRLVNRFVKNGWARFLPKPYDVATLLQKVQSALATENGVTQPY